MSAPSVLLVGATSGLGRALAEEYAAAGSRVLLAGRSRARVAAVAGDLRIRHRAEVVEIEYDAADGASAGRAAEAILAAGVPDAVLFVLGDNGAPDAPFRPEEIARVHAVNFGGPAALLAHLLPHVRARPGSSIAFVGSAAGERGRSGNFVYGSAKAALAVYAQGLRAMLWPARVAVTTIILGWVDTRLAYGLVPPALTASPAWAARAIRRAIERRRDVAYVPGVWRLVMLAIRSIPEWLFKRLRLP
jgi:NAD(P)-dependent dehydrogenase (short-subunit alcohol dehydrogenase family)